MLRDAAGFAFCHTCLANCVKQAGLTVIHVAHHSYDRGASFGIFHRFGRDLEFGFDNHVLEGTEGNFKAKSSAYFSGNLGVHGLIDRRHHSALEQLRHHLFRFDVEFFRELTNGGTFHDANSFEVNRNHAGRSRRNYCLTGREA